MVVSLPRRALPIPAVTRSPKYKSVPADWFGDIAVSKTFVVVPRPRPNPGPRVAPPVADAYAPWVSVLDDKLVTREYRWVLADDGALVPTPVADEETATVRPKRSWRIPRTP
jgi:hypothetical protein